MAEKRKSTKVAVGKGREGREKTPVVAMPVLRCPHCGGRDHVVTSSRASEGRRMRYHKCRNCRKRFVTYDLEGGGTAEGGGAVETSNGQE